MYARVRNTEDKIGFLPLQDLRTGLLFGNFVAVNKDGKAYALCYNTDDEPVALSPPLIELEPSEIMREKDDIFDPDTLKEFNEEEIEHIRNLINERPHLFGLPGEKLRATHLVTHKLITTTDTPIRVKRHRHPPAIKEEMLRQINTYLDEGIIRPLDSPYSSMMWVVPKKSGKNGEKRWRMVTDFCQ